MTLRSVGLVCAAAIITATAACTIIVQPGTKEPAPIPIQIPLACEATGMAPTAHIFFDVRLNRTTTNLVAYYAKMMRATALALAAAKIVPTEAVLIRLDEKPVDPPVLAAWGCNLDNPDVLTPEMVLEHYATGPALPASPIGCATDPLHFAGAHLGELVTQYPAGLPGTSGKRMFGWAPTIVLVIHIDERARAAGFDDAACASSHDLAKNDNGMASWLAYNDGIGGERVIHWFIATEEGVDRDTFLDACKSYEGFPSDALDLIDPSDEALYGPLASAIADRGAGHVATMPLCAMLVETELAAFLNENIRTIAEIAGTTIDEAALASVLSGGMLPVTEPGGDR